MNKSDYIDRRNKHLSDTSTYEHLQDITNELEREILDKLHENGKLPQTCILASIDVSSLYTNIPHLEGREAVTKKLSLNQDPPPLQPQLVVIGELIDIVLQNNVFKFNDKLYLQKQGTAMGTKMAPSYANLFMGKMEKQLQKPRQTTHTHLEEIHR